MDAKRGMRDKLSKYINIMETTEVILKIDGSAEYDFCCFGVDSEEKLAEEGYMIFYNQTSSPNNEITYSKIDGGAVFRINTGIIPDKVKRLVFTASIDGDGTMGQINSHTFTIGNVNSPAVSGEFKGSDFNNEKAIIIVELYKKDEWRFAVSEKGFDGGIKELLHYFGGVEEEEENETEQVKETPPVPTVQPAPTVQPVQSAPPAKPRLSLEKKLESAPELLSLAKPIKIQLEKKSLTDCVARVALVMDISGSMSQSYENGTVQEIVNKILPLAVQFDDDGQLDFWFYGTRCEKRDPVNLKNYKNAVPDSWKNIMRALGYGNNESAVMSSVITEYSKTKIPAYVIFVTDGGVSHTQSIKELLTISSKLPIFWQFVGVSGSMYGVLKKLDKLKGRYVDNANFFALDDFRKVSDDELYDRLLNEFPVWLKEIKNLGMI